MSNLFLNLSGPLASKLGSLTPTLKPNENFNLDEPVPDAPATEAKASTGSKSSLESSLVGQGPS